MDTFQKIYGEISRSNSTQISFMQVAETWSPGEIMAGNQNSDVRCSANNRLWTKGVIVAQLLVWVGSLNPGTNCPHAEVSFGKTSNAHLLEKGRVRHGVLVNERPL